MSSAIRAIGASVKEVEESRMAAQQRQKEREEKKERFFGNILSRYSQTQQRQQLIEKTRDGPLARLEKYADPFKVIDISDAKFDPHYHTVLKWMQQPTDKALTPPETSAFYLCVKRLVELVEFYGKTIDAIDVTRYFNMRERNPNPYGVVVHFRADAPVLYQPDFVLDDLFGMTTTVLLRWTESTPPRGDSLRTKWSEFAAENLESLSACSANSVTTKSRFHGSVELCSSRLHALHRRDQFMVIINLQRAGRERMGDAFAQASANQKGDGLIYWIPAEHRLCRPSDLAGSGSGSGSGSSSSSSSAASSSSSSSSFSFSFSSSSSSSSTAARSYDTIPGAVVLTYQDLQALRSFGMDRSDVISATDRIADALKAALGCDAADVLSRIENSSLHVETRTITTRLSEKITTRAQLAVHSYYRGLNKMNTTDAPFVLSIGPSLGYEFVAETVNVDPGNSRPMSFSSRRRELTVYPTQDLIRILNRDMSAEEEKKIATSWVHDPEFLVECPKCNSEVVDDAGVFNARLNSTSETKYDKMIHDITGLNKHAVLVPRCVYFL